jgi:hypothetical protein
VKAIKRATLHKFISVEQEAKFQISKLSRVLSHAVRIKQIKWHDLGWRPYCAKHVFNSDKVWFCVCEVIFFTWRFTPQFQTLSTT